MARILHWHSHDHDAAPLSADPALRNNNEGIRAVWLALIALSATALIQVFISIASGSAALISDTAHNIGDSLNSIPLLLALYLARRGATRRFTYGFERAEDIAGVVIVLSIAVSAVTALWTAFDRLLNPKPMENIPWVIAAALIGFAGNEAVALFQIRTGRRIGSEAMVADGLHARVDGLTSLAVLIAAGGTLLGAPVLDPIIGLVIGVTIVWIAKDASTRVFYRMMDAVDPALVHQIEHVAGEIEGVNQVAAVRARWIGHVLHGELTLVVDESLTLIEGQRATANVRAALKHALPFLGDVVVQTEVRYDIELEVASGGSAFVLPPRYENFTPSAAPMGAAALKYDAEGEVAWDEVWQDFCDLALAGGPPHRGTLLEPPSPEQVAANSEGYARVLAQLERGIRLVTGLPVMQSKSPGWIGMRCDSEEMALWLLRAILVENVAVRREGDVLYFPAGPDFRVESEIKNVITVIAKTTHYWNEHAGAPPS